MTHEGEDLAREGSEEIFKPTRRGRGRRAAVGMQMTVWAEKLNIRPAIQGKPGVRRQRKMKGSSRKPEENTERQRLAIIRRLIVAMDTE